MLNLHPGVMCFHEAVNTVDSPYMEAAGAAVGYDHVGDSSSAACLIDWPKETKRVFINRDFNDVRKSMDRLKMSENIEDSLRRVKHWSGTAQYHFRFHDIFYADADDRLKLCEAILAVCCPGVRFDALKVNTLLRHQVQLQSFNDTTYDIETFNRRLKDSKWAQ